MSKVIELGNKLTGIEKIHKLAEAMQVVAVAQLKKAQVAQRSAAHYLEHYGRAAAKVGLELKPAAVKVKPAILVYVFASERGFCGGFNQALLSSLHEKKARLVVLGRKGGEVFKEAGLEFEPRVGRGFADVASLAGEGAELFKQGEVNEIYLCYNQFKSMLVQQPVCRRILPFEVKPWSPDFTLLEPSLAAVRSFVSLNYLKAIFYDAFMQSRLGEVASRLMTMRSASENAKEMIADLRIKFNKARQAMITVELSEILSSFEILNEGVG